MIGPRWRQTALRILQYNIPPSTNIPPFPKVKKWGCGAAEGTRLIYEDETSVSLDMYYLVL
jgi:hypothetical protein